MASDDDVDRRDGLTGRFQKGVSGNPRGRPRKPNTVAAAITGALGEKVSVTENGRRKRLTKLEATAKQLANKGASGDLRAGKLAFDLAQTAEEKRAAMQPADAELSASDEEIVERLLARLRRIIKEEQEDGTGNAG